METRVAVLALIVQEGSSVQALNELLHQYGPYIIGRMGVPYRERGVNIISVALDAPNDVISALSGKLGRLDHRPGRNTGYARAGGRGPCHRPHRRAQGSHGDGTCQAHERRALLRERTAL